MQRPEGESAGNPLSCVPSNEKACTFAIGQSREVQTLAFARHRVPDKETKTTTCNSSLYPAPQLDVALLMYKPGSLEVKTPVCLNRLGTTVQERRGHVKVTILAKNLSFSLK